MRNMHPIVIIEYLAVTSMIRGSENALPGLLDPVEAQLVR